MISSIPGTDIQFETFHYEKDGVIAVVVVFGKTERQVKPKSITVVIDGIEVELEQVSMRS